MIIEIKGVEFENKGAQLMLCAITEQVTRIWPDAEFALTPSKKASFFQRSRVPAWQKLALRKNLLDLNRLSYWLPSIVRSKLRDWGIVTEADVDIIIDASGFSYSDQWPSKIRIYHLKNELKRFRQKGKPYVFMPQAFGPFTTKISQDRIAQSFKDATMICAREEQSFKHINDITGPIPNLYQYGDFTNLMDGIVPSYFDVSVRWACIVPNTNMVNPRNTNKAWISRYESILLEAVIYYKESGLTPFFLNHEGNEDGALIEKINSKLATPIKVVAEADPRVVKGIIASSEAVLCSRYHGCVSALSSGVACVGTSWSHKYELLYQDYRAPELLLNPLMSNKELKDVIDLSLQNSGALTEKLVGRASDLKLQSLEMWEELLRLLESQITIEEKQKS